MLLGGMHWRNLICTFPARTQLAGRVLEFLRQLRGEGCVRIDRVRRRGRHGVLVNAGALGRPTPFRPGLRCWDWFLTRGLRRSAATHWGRLVDRVALP